MNPNDPAQPGASPPGGSFPSRGPARIDAWTAVLAELPAADRELLELALAAVGHNVLDCNGIRIGKVMAVLVDRETGRPQWLSVHARHRPRENTVGMPVVGLSNAGGIWWTSLEADQVRAAPLIPTGSVSARIEQALCRYYRLPPTRGAAQGRWERRATCGRAFRDPETPGVIGWAPAPRRGPSGGETAPLGPGALAPSSP